MNEVESFFEDAVTSVAILGGLINITDRIFLEIESSPELMQGYNELYYDTMNADLGKYIRERLSLTNIGRCYSPQSQLIRSYEKHGVQ